MKNTRKYYHITLILHTQNRWLCLMFSYRTAVRFHFRHVGLFCKWHVLQACHWSPFSLLFHLLPIFGNFGWVGWRVFPWFYPKMTPCSSLTTTHHGVNFGWVFLFILLSIIAIPNEDITEGISSFSFSMKMCSICKLDTSVYKWTLFLDKLRKWYTMLGYLCLHVHTSLNCFYFSSCVPVYPLICSLLVTK